MAKISYQAVADNTWVGGTETPVIIYGVNFVTNASGGMYFEAPDGEGNYFTKIYETVGDAVKYTRNYGPNGVVFPLGCRTQVTNTTHCTVFYQLLNNQKDTETYDAPAIPHTDRQTGDVNIISAGTPVLLYGLNSYGSGGDDFIKIYDGSDNTGTLVLQQNFPTEDTNVIFNPPLVFPNGCFLEPGTGIQAADYMYWYRKL